MTSCQDRHIVDQRQWKTFRPSGPQEIDHHRVVGELARLTGQVGSFDVHTACLEFTDSGCEIHQFLVKLRPTHSRVATQCGLEYANDWHDENLREKGIRHPTY
ncbi:hypothetical protein TPCG7_00720 [Cutibacterium granulosum]|nr:hypothetical protein TPCG7_00720 [Cutibacterium granulosum]